MENPNLKGYVALLNTEPQYHFSGFSISFILIAHVEAIPSFCICTAFITDR
jgi:hypothetical protein